jgi:hypothetical protein
LKDSDPGFKKLTLALASIQRYDSVRFCRIKRDIPLIWIVPTKPSRAVWNNRLKACILDRDFVYSEINTPGDIASTIVHEATHARLRNLGIGYDEKVRKRVEDVCIRAQLRFTQKLPDGARAFEHAKLCLNLPEDFWTDDARNKRRMEALQNIKGAPKWLVRWAEKRLEKRSKTK